MENFEDSEPKQGLWFPDVTRIELIDETGRAYVRWGASVELSIQDKGKTLKIFISPIGARPS